MMSAGRIVRCLAAFALMITVLAGIQQPAVAQTQQFPSNFKRTINECYFPSVGNGEDFGLGASQTSITVQNLADEIGMIFIYTGSPTGFVNADHATLEPGASKTFTAKDLGIASGTTVPVVVAGLDLANAQAGTFSLARDVALGCFAKQAVGGGNLPLTSAVDSSVSGYTATSGREIAAFATTYLPIVQTNCGPGGCWDTTIRIANVGRADLPNVRLSFHPTDNASGALGQGFDLNAAVASGNVWSIKLSDHVPDGWVGSVHVDSSASVIAMADRYKVGTRMWITNTAAGPVSPSSTAIPNAPGNAPYLLYAPDVRLDFSGWNSGISVANTAGSNNAVTIRYYGAAGAAPAPQTQQLAPFAMTYFYNPASPADEACPRPIGGVATCDFVGGAIVLSQEPVAVAVDAVKYVGSDRDVGQAFGYVVAGNLARVQSAPLMQKGSPATGMGATSGLTFLNPNAEGTFATARWLNSNGSNAGNGGNSTVWLPAWATGYIYTMQQGNVPTNWTGSAIVTSQLPIIGGSANADYQVAGDGTGFFNLANPCGFYRNATNCAYQAAPEALATKTFTVAPARSNALICAFSTPAGRFANNVECAPRYITDPEGVAVGGNPAYMMNLQEFVDGQLTPLTETFAQVTLDTANTQVSVSMYEGGNRNVFTPTVSLWALHIFKPGANNVIPNLTCAALGTASASGELEVFGPLRNIPVTRQRLATFSEPTKGVLMIRQQGATAGSFREFCGELETGVLRLENGPEIQSRLGLVVPPFSVNAAGAASIDLAAGCYTFVVSANNYRTHRSESECLSPGQTLNNAVNLGQPLVTPTPTASVTTTPSPSPSASPSGTTTPVTSTPETPTPETPTPETPTPETPTSEPTETPTEEPTETSTVTPEPTYDALTIQFCQVVEDTTCTNPVTGLSIELTNTTTQIVVLGPKVLTDSSTTTDTVPDGDYTVCWEKTESTSADVESDCADFNKTGVTTKLVKVTVVPPAPTYDPLTIQFCQAVGTGGDQPACSTEVSGMRITLTNPTTSTDVLGPMTLLGSSTTTTSVPAGDYSLCWEASASATDAVLPACKPVTAPDGGGTILVQVSLGVWLDVCVADGVGGPGLAGATVNAYIDNNYDAPIASGITDSTGRASFPIDWEYQQWWAFPLNVSASAPGYTASDPDQGFVGPGFEPGKGACATAPPSTAVLYGTTDRPVISLKPLPTPPGESDGFGVSLNWNGAAPPEAMLVRVFNLELNGQCPTIPFFVSPPNVANGTTDPAGAVDLTDLPRGVEYCIAISPADGGVLAPLLLGPTLLPAGGTELLPINVNLAESFGYLNFGVALDLVKTELPVTNIASVVNWLKPGQDTTPPPLTDPLCQGTLYGGANLEPSLPTQTLPNDAHEEYSMLVLAGTYCIKAEAPTQNDNPQNPSNRIYGVLQVAAGTGAAMPVVILKPERISAPTGDLTIITQGNAANRPAPYTVRPLVDGVCIEDDARTGVTGASGESTIAVPEGEWCVNADPNGDDVFARANPATVDISSGNATSATVNEALLGTLRLVTQVGGQPPAGAVSFAYSIYVYTEFPGGGGVWGCVGGLYQGETDPDGTIDLVLSSRTYCMIAADPNGDLTNTKYTSDGSDLVVVAHNQVTTVVINEAAWTPPALVHQLDLTTTVGGNSPNMRVTYRVSYASGETPACGGTLAAVGSTNVDGTVSVPLAPGWYCVDANPNNDAYFSSAVLFEIAENDTNPMELTIDEPATGALTVIQTVRYQRVPTSRWFQVLRYDGVACNNLPANVLGTYATITDTGELTLNLAPGGYCIAANPAMQQNFLPSQYVEVVAGQTRSISINVGEPGGGGGSCCRIWL